MKWVTTANVHFDRVASPWLIRRFIDPKAEFSFLARGQEKNLPPDAIPIAVPGTPKLGPHDKDGTTFTKLLKEYKLTEPALQRMAKVVDEGVRFVIEGFRPEKGDREGEIAIGYLAFSDGMILTKTNDMERLEASFVAYDALYALFKKGEGLSLKARVESPEQANSGRTS